MDNQKNGILDRLKAALQPTIEKAKALLKNTNAKIVAVVLAVVIFALAVTLFLNASSEQYTVLYSGIDTTETTEIFSLLKLKGAEPKLSAEGEVMVLTDEFDIWLLQLASEGYPKSGTPNYSYYADNIGMTTTQSENEQWALYQLQEDIATTLERINSVTEASVIINLASTSDYVWEQATSTSTGSVAVMLTPVIDTDLTNEQVLAIKTIVAAGVPNTDIEDVKVINSRTSLEMGLDLTQDDDYTNTITALQNYELEAIVQNQIEANILRLLSPRYGDDGVVATAKVTLNYDKMISESLELIERPIQEDGSGGGGFTTSTSGYYGLDGETTYGGIVGEEDNTDIPTYPYGGINDEDVTYYTWNTEFDYSYIKSQIEAGYAEVERVTISVLVDEEYLSDARQLELISLISTSADIPFELITVSSIDAPAVVEPDNDIQITEEVQITIFDFIPWYVFLIIAIIIIIIIVVTIILRRRSKRKRLAKDKESERLIAEQKAQAEKMLAEYKNNIASGVHTEEQEKQEAIIDEIRDFTTSNPEIAASLIRNWLKEEE